MEHAVRMSLVVLIICDERKEGKKILANPKNKPERRKLHEPERGKRAKRVLPIDILCSFAPLMRYERATSRGRERERDHFFNALSSFLSLLFGPRIEIRRRSILQSFGVHGKDSERRRNEESGNQNEIGGGCIRSRGKSPHS